MSPKYVSEFLIHYNLELIKVYNCYVEGIDTVMFCS